MPTPQPKPSKVVHEIVDPRWIVSALAAMLTLCVLCAYVAVCALFYRGQWQLVLQPSRTVSQTPASIGLPFTEVHFGVDATGQPQLDGWWIPGDSPSDPTALILHSGYGSISDALPDARILHDAQLNVLLFDYRGYGRSGGQHPTQQLMQADAESALRYLTEIRSIPTSQIVIFGRFLGASLAIQLCADHKDIPALILEQPQGDSEPFVKMDSRSRMVPVHLLLNQTFPLAVPLHTLPTPKLLISWQDDKYPIDPRQAADPKMTVEFGPGPAGNVHNAIRRFLDTYLTQAPATLSPTP